VELGVELELDLVEVFRQGVTELPEPDDAPLPAAIGGEAGVEAGAGRAPASAVGVEPGVSPRRLQAQSKARSQ
jgi:hypothetical protein